MSGELVPSTGVAVAPADAGGALVERESWREAAQPTHAPAHAWQPKDPAKLADLTRQIIRDMMIDGIGEAQIKQCLAVLDDYEPAMRAAHATSNEAELTRIGYLTANTIVNKGLLTPDQIPRVAAIFARYAPDCALATRGPGAGDTGLVDEMLRLEALMARPGSKYWRGVDADRLQARWRELFDKGVRTPDAD